MSNLNFAIITYLTARFSLWVLLTFIFIIAHLLITCSMTLLDRGGKDKGNIICQHKVYNPVTGGLIRQIHKTQSQKVNGLRKIQIKNNLDIERGRGNVYV